MNVHSYSVARQSIGYLEHAGANLAKSLGRLSSGTKINTSEDDAGGLAVSAKINSAITRSLALKENVQNGLSFLETQDAAQNQLGEIITRMAELRQRFDDTTRNSQDGTVYNREFKELKEEVESLAKKKFNGISLFSNESDDKSKLIVNTSEDGKNSSSAITRNLFFKSILETKSPGGPVGATRTTQGAFGSYSGTITPTGDTTPDQTVNGADGSTPAQLLKGLQGTTTTQTVNGTIGGTTPNQTVNALQGSTPVKNDLKATQGTVSGLTISAKLNGTPPAPLTLNATIGNAPQALWQGSFNNVSSGFHRLSPVFDTNGDIIVGTMQDDELYRLDPNDGRILTTYDMGSGGNLSWESAVTDDTVYAANGDGDTLFAFDKVTGAQKWTKTLSGRIQDPPFVASNGNIYIACDSSGFTPGEIHAYQPDGTSLPGWPKQEHGTFRGGFAEAADGTLYLTSGRNFGIPAPKTLMAIDPTSGAIKWSKTNTEINRVLRAAAVAPDQSVVINSRDGGITRAFNPDGTDKWTYSSGGDIFGGPTIDAATGNVFVAYDNGVVALQSNGTNTPNVLWNYSAGFNAQTVTPAFDPARNLVYVANTATGEIIALDATGGGSPAGSVAWTYNTGSAVVASPALDANGNVYIGNTNGDFFAISVYDYINNPAVTDGIGSSYDPAEPAPAVIIDGADKGSLAATATVNPDGTLKLNFTGKASGVGNLTATIKNIAGTPPPADPAGSNYLTAETAPSARVLADGIASKPATLQANLISLIDGNTAAPAGGGTITDSSGNANNGTVAAGQEPGQEVKERRTGAGAYVFDGNNDKILLGDLNAAIGGQDKLTISAWIYREDTADDRIVCKSSGTNAGDHVFSLGVVDAGSSQSKVRMHISTDTMVAVSMDGSLTFPLNEWTHLAMTYDGTNLRSYVNGEQDSNVFSVNGNIKTSTDPVTIGNVNNAQNRHFEGMLDDVGIWNRALSASELEDLAGPGNLTATTAINADGSLKVTPAGTPATDGSFTVDVDPGVLNLQGISETGSGYDGATPESAPNVTITGADKGTAAGTATVRADGKLDIAFTGTPTGTGNLTLTVDPGVIRNPADLVGIANPTNLYDPAEPAPTVTITGADKGTLAGTATIRPDGNVNVALAGIPAGTGNLTVAVADGRDKAPANLAGIGSGYDPGEAVPAVTITGADAGTLAGISTINANGTIDVAFSGNPSDIGNLTVAVADGVVRKPADLTSIGSGYDPAEPAPAVTFAGASAGTLSGTSSINGDGTLNVTLAGAPTDTNDVTMNVANGLPGVADLTGIGSGYTTGDPAPGVTVSGANAGTLAGTASINANGTLDVNFTGNPSDTNNVTVQIADGLARVANLSGVGSGYDPGEAAPGISITGANKNTLNGAATINANGTLDVSFGGNPADFNSLGIQAADGVTQAPNALTGLGGNHDPGSPPAVTITGADKGTLASVASVNADGTVNVSFTGSPSGPGPLTVQIPGGVASNPISNQYLLEIDGDLWDYTVAEFVAFTSIIADARAQNGAEQNSLNTNWNSLSTRINQLEQANGRITDTDFAEEMTKLGKSQILSQSASSMLAKYNRTQTEALLKLQNLAGNL
jgi:flagellin-like hook-associated protein FlgL